MDFAKFLRTPFLQNTSGGSFWMKQKFKNPFWLTRFMLLVSFYTPSNHQKTFGFLMFSGGIERDQWDEMELKVI